MAYEFPDYIADLLIASQKARQTGSHQSADMLDDQLSFAVQDAMRTKEISDPPKFKMKVAHSIVLRGGSDLFGILSGESMSKK